MEGYGKIAKVMSYHDELAILRRFSELNMQDLLYSQAEILQLKDDLQDLAEKDSSHQGRELYAKDWWSLANNEDDSKKEQWKKVLEIRERLKDYNAHLAQQAYLFQLSGPNPYDLNKLRDWLQRPKMGNFPLRGLDQNTWDESNKVDLVALNKRGGGGIFARWVIDTLVPLSHILFGKRLKKPIAEDPASEICEYSDAKILSFVRIVGTVLASTLPISSIIVLYFVTYTLARLGIVVAFTALFSLCLVLVTEAKQVEIFAATSAFAAVQVVFVSGNGGTAISGC